MIEIDKTLVSNELLEAEFICNLSACKGACCVAGDAGAPLEEDEAKKLQEIYPKLLPYLNEAGKKAITEQGVWVKDPYDEAYKCSPLVENKECAYVVFEANGTAKCGIEHAYNDGAVDFIKPISCHLYPIRIQKYKSFEAINYHKWSVCAPACALGAEMKLPVFRFLKEPLVRKFGKEWFEKLEAANNYIQSQKKDTA